jgi:lambda repressor-like predicted transcriptional regulator
MKKTTLNDRICAAVLEGLKEKGMSKYRLSKLSGVSPNNLQMITGGQNTAMRTPTAEALLDTLGYEIVIRKKVPNDVQGE